MIITNILHVSGTKADLFSASFFKGVENERKPINPFTKWVDGRLFAYGMIKDIFGTTRICIDLRAAKESCGFTGEGDDPLAQINSCVRDREEDEQTKEHVALQYRIENPPVPPSKAYCAWKYRHVIYEHQFSTWEKVGTYGKWVPTTETCTMYVKEDRSEITPVLTSDTNVLPFKHYYFIDKYDLPTQPTEKFVDIEFDIGDDIVARRNLLQAYYENRYPEQAEAGKIDVKIYEVDITQAEQVPTKTEHDQYLMGYWLGHYSDYPNMISVDDNNHVIASYGSWKEPFMEGDFEYRHSLPDAVFDFNKAIVTRETTLPICNGLCCFPRMIKNRIYASQGQRLSYNKQDRNRRWVLVDFSPVGGCTFIQLKDLVGNLTQMDLPSGFDSTKQSLLLVVKGRLFTPDEFEVINNKKLLFDITKYIAQYDIDTLLCRGDKKFNSIVLEKRFKYTLKDDDNSFLVVINKPNLQVVRHKCFQGSWPMTKMRWGSDSHGSTAKCDFDQPARGLLFDESTKSVIDYTRETQTMTFYADKARRWGISNTHVNWQTLFAVTDESSDNLMSARGFVLDTVYTDRYNHVIWPRLSILDFIFRG